jgi:hypothetical protein
MAVEHQVMAFLSRVAEHVWRLRMRRMEQRAAQQLLWNLSRTAPVAVPVLTSAVAGRHASR